MWNGGTEQMVPVTCPPICIVVFIFRKESEVSHKMVSLAENDDLEKKASFIQYGVTQGKVQSYLHLYHSSTQGMGGGC